MQSFVSARRRGLGQPLAVNGKDVRDAISGGRRIGHWVLRGTIARVQTTHHVTFDWMLGRAYVYSARADFSPNEGSGP